jgi:WD40 repeat protein
MQGGRHIVEIRDGKLRTWNLNPLQLIEERPIDSFNPPDVVLAISPDGKRLCGARLDGTLELRDLSDWSTVEFTTCKPAPFARFSPNGDRVALFGFPLPKCSEYDASTGMHLRDYDVTLARALSYSADGQRVAIAFESGDVVIYDVVTGEETLRLDVVASALQFARNGRSLLTNSTPDGAFYVWPGKQ